MGIPGTMLTIPIFMLFLRLNLMNTAAGLIIIYICTSIPFTVYFLTAFFASLPTELEEAARIDGATSFQAFWQIMLPLAQPGIITVSIFNFLGMWNEYFWALIFVNSDEHRTLMLGLEAVMRAMRYTGDYGGMFASIMIIFLPTFIIYIFISEKIVSGITAGAIKS
jgi:N-acetylglucosamine transport system permease protein